MWVSDRIQTVPTRNTVTPTSSHAMRPTFRSHGGNDEDPGQVRGVDLDELVLGGPGSSSPLRRRSRPRIMPDRLKVASDGKARPTRGPGARTAERLRQGGSAPPPCGRAGGDPLEPLYQPAPPQSPASRPGAATKVLVLRRGDDRRDRQASGGMGKGRDQGCRRFAPARRLRSRPSTRSRAPT